MRDPVSGFEYPDEWSLRLDPDVRAAVAGGLSVLTADGTVLHRGFTTGTTAAAAAKASVISLAHPVTDGVEIQTPAGIRVFVKACGRDGHGTSIKYSGDYPGDVTSGLCFHAEAIPAEEGIIITRGNGIGIWERNTPRYRKGSPAVSQPALEEIRLAVAEALADTHLRSVQVRLSADNGEQIAEHTLNAKVGVTGGISVLGSTGFVEPWDDHLEESVLKRITAASRVVLTTGRVGLRYSRLLFPQYEVILVGSRLDPAIKKANGEVIICGLPALILKYINPSILEGSGYGSVEEMTGTTEFFTRADQALSQFCLNHPGIRVVLIDRAGRIIKEAP